MEPTARRSECRILEDHFNEVFASDELEPTVPQHRLTQMPFTIEDLHCAFAHVNPNKAVGPMALPNIFVRALAPDLANWTFNTLKSHWMTQPFEVPQQWRDAWLTLLAKKTTVRSPRDLRPIALTDSIGKVVLGVLTHKLKMQLLPTLSSLPLFAYLPGRSTTDALMFVFDHCRQIRSLCQASTWSYWQRSSRACRPSLCGGLMLSLDLSQAFDRLPRDLLAEGFDVMAPSSELAHLLLHWLTEVRYHISHRSHGTTIKTSRGVRQGCKASPIEWTIFLCTILMRLDLDLWHMEPMWHHLITYADDLIAKWRIESKQQFLDSLSQLSKLLSILDSAGMKVNFQKTVILLRLEGSTHKSVLKKHTMKQNGQTFLCVPHMGRTLRIPIVHEHVYLGTKISYYKFEDSTLSYRLHISRVTFLRLRPLLTGRKALPLHLRVRLWVACIQSSSLHGLDATGLTPTGCGILHRRFTRDIRQLARSPSHITHETTAQVFERLGLPLPLEHVHRTWSKRASKRREFLEGLTAFDFLLNFDFSRHYQAVLATVQEATSSPAQMQELMCSYCEHVAPTQSALTRHLHTKHEMPSETQIFHRLRDAKLGHPQCAHCLYKFPTMRNLSRHITKSHCMVFDAEKPWQEPLADSSIVRSLVLADDWENLRANEEIMTKLRHECVLCKAWTTDNKQLHAHLRKEHREAWDSTQSTVQLLAHRMPYGACKACENKSARSHVCPVLRQIALVGDIAMKDTTVPAY